MPPKYKITLAKLELISYKNDKQSEQYSTTSYYASLSCSVFLAVLFSSLVLDCEDQHSHFVSSSLVAWPADYYLFVAPCAALLSFVYDQHELYRSDIACKTISWEEQELF